MTQNRSFVSHFGPKKFICFVLGIHSYDFFEILDDDFVLEVNKGVNDKYFSKNSFWPENGAFYPKLDAKIYKPSSQNLL